MFSLGGVIGTILPRNPPSVGKENDAFFHDLVPFGGLNARVFPCDPVSETRKSSVSNKVGVRDDPELIKLCFLGLVLGQQIGVAVADLLYRVPAALHQIRPQAFLKDLAVVPLEDGLAFQPLDCFGAHRLVLLGPFVVTLPEPTENDLFHLGRVLKDGVVQSAVAILVVMLHVKTELRDLF